MEPRSDFYTGPLVVLDFQSFYPSVMSFYPSVMIAYNYCYTTFLARAVRWRGRDKMGFLDYQQPPRLLELLKDSVNIAPNGMISSPKAVDTEKSQVDAALLKLLVRLMISAVSCDNLWVMDPMPQGLYERHFQEGLSVIDISSEEYQPHYDPPLAPWS
ncbi:DNA polymerase zeta catalytic subunit [Penicillium subrubescens]|uniref:DNA-directed DNA polymerase n=1 Tax=Penicillium subrubescens TaxID=1316194 RepID=A0A1Q5U3V1_9EURO|nr:DNA polymerase zeta catalytic subunit [Penicillium subrubescens]